MAETPSNMIPLGTIAPDFCLVDTRTDQSVTLDQIKSQTATVIMFICNHCPYVKHIQGALVDIAKTYQAKGFSFVAISSNDSVGYPQDGPDNMRQEAEKHDYSFPYLFDETQAVAKAYHAACTPDFYIFDGNLHCIYRGRFDGSTPGNGLPVTGEDLLHALEAVLSGKPINPDQKASLGCNIKWKKK